MVALTLTLTCRQLSQDKILFPNIVVHFLLELTLSGQLTINLSSGAYQVPISTLLNPYWGCGDGAGDGGMKSRGKEERTALGGKPDNQSGELPRRSKMTRLKVGTTAKNLDLAEWRKAESSEISEIQAIRHFPPSATPPMSKSKSGLLTLGKLVQLGDFQDCILESPRYEVRIWKNGTLTLTVGVVGIREWLMKHL